MAIAAAMANNMTIRYIDTLEYVRQSKSIKDPEALASYQVKQIESAIETAVQYVKKDVQDETARNNEGLATKTDVSELKVELKADISELKAELKADISELRTDMVELKAELKADVSELRTDMVELKAELKADIAELKTGMVEIKSELKAVTAELKVDMLKYIFAAMVASVTLLGGLVAHGFHWF